MYNLISADIYKLRKSLAIKILFVITSISAVIMTIMAYLIPQGKVAPNMTGIGFLFSDVNTISILGAVIAGIFICGDFDNKIIHDAITNGYSRRDVIISKATVLFCSTAFILLPYAIVTGIAVSTGFNFNMGTVAVGFMHILVTEAGTVITASGVLKLLVIMITLMIVYMAQLSISVLLGILLKKPVLVVAIYYGLTIICAQLASLKGSSPVFDRILECTPLGGNYTFMTLDTSIEDILKAIIVSLLFIIIILAITYSAFRKSEIK